MHLFSCFDPLGDALISIGVSCMCGELTVIFTFTIYISMTIQLIIDVLVHQE